MAGKPFVIALDCEVKEAKELQDRQLYRIGSAILKIISNEALSAASQGKDLRFAIFSQNNPLG